MLFIIPTPIGNLKDITLRAIETLKACDYLLCEDTRETFKLLSHYEIKKPLFSYHKFNESKISQKVIDDLEKGLIIGLVSDAGTPVLCDPGQIVVSLARQKNLEVVALPGPCAAITALSGSGFKGDQFAFCGFIPKQAKAKQDLFSLISKRPGIHIFYETSKRLKDTLTTLSETHHSSKICIAKELSKLYEHYFFGTAQQLIETLKDEQYKGEWVILIEITQSIHESKEPLNLMEELQKLLNQGMSPKNSVKLLSDITGCSKQELFKLLNASSSNED